MSQNEKRSRRRRRRQRTKRPTKRAIDLLVNLGWIAGAAAVGVPLLALLLGLLGGF